MNRIVLASAGAALIAVLFFQGCSTKYSLKSESAGYIDLDTVQAGRFDTGRMWTLDFLPKEYLQDTYGFNPSEEWFEKARLSTLRLPNCTASFLSEDGLVMTNHHCARTALDSVNREGEELAIDGFYASTLEEERKANGVYIDQLLLMEDVSQEVKKAFENGTTDREKIINRDAKIKEIQAHYAEKYRKAVPSDSMVFRVIPFYNGGRYSLYGYKRYTDIRLVYAPEDAIAFFGGNADNFTYPRYDFDCAFFRVYENGRPLKVSNFFRLNPEGVKEGDVVFIIGNPGTTRRLYTIVQLEHLRDIEYPTRIDYYKKVGDIFSAYISQHPEAKAKYINTVFGLENSWKANTGYLSGLRDPVLMAKKKDFENKFKEKILSNPELRKKFGDPWADIKEYQADLSAIYSELDALKFRGKYFSKYLTLTSDLIDIVKNSKDVVSDSAKKAFYPSDFNPEIEEQLLTNRLEYMRKVFNGKNEAFNTLLAGRPPQEAAKALASGSIIASRAKTESLLSGRPDDLARSSDLLLQFILATRDYTDILQEKNDANNRMLQARMQVLGNALYEVYGVQIPPDATFTLRIADGVVKGYEYNGTVAPVITTFYGLFDRYYSFGMKDLWQLPSRWKNPPSSLKLNTPMNFICTADIIGGNSGSPAINKNQEVVGLIFDGNMESLPGNIIFDETKNRSMGVHSAAIIEALDKIYKADRLVKELRLGKISN